MGSGSRILSIGDPFSTQAWGKQLLRTATEPTFIEKMFGYRTKDVDKFLAGKSIKQIARTEEGRRAAERAIRKHMKWLAERREEERKKSERRLDSAPK